MDFSYELIILVKWSLDPANGKQPVRPQSTPVKGLTMISYQVFVHLLWNVTVYSEGKPSSSYCVCILKLVVVRTSLISKHFLSLSVWAVFSTTKMHHLACIYVRNCHHSDTQFVVDSLHTYCFYLAGGKFAQSGILRMATPGCTWQGSSPPSVLFLNTLSAELNVLTRFDMLSNYPDFDTL